MVKTFYFVPRCNVSLIYSDQSTVLTHFLLALPQIVLSNYAKNEHYQRKLLHFIVIDSFFKLQIYKKQIHNAKV